MDTDSDALLERRRRSFALLREAVDVTGGAREEWIERHCTDDAALAAELRRLLASDEAGLLDGNAGVIAAWLTVFPQLGDAVAHAHHHLLVHRDIEPENVLVTVDGHARLLDFGIAKLLEPDADQTATQRRFVSRACAAPEQKAHLDQVDFDEADALMRERLTPLAV